MNHAATTTEAPASADQQLVYALLGAAHMLEDRVEQRLAPVGLSASKLSVLTQLVQAGEPLALSELAARLSCVRSNMTQLVDRLEADGLVRRVDDPADRRSVLAEVTAAGQSRQQSGAAELAAVRAEFLAPLAEPHRTALLQALAELA
ncbi:MAG TPA: MarR family transcriptional regulator [Gemmatimonadales bacterium]|jgi:DNA-binding MarR family transcriptional regulator